MCSSDVMRRRLFVLLHDCVVQYCAELWGMKCSPCRGCNIMQSGPNSNLDYLTFITFDVFDNQTIVRLHWLRSGRNSIMISLTTDQRFLCC